MPPVIRRRPLSPNPRAIGSMQSGASRGRCASLIRLTILVAFIVSVLYFASGFREAVEAASQKMAVLRKSTSPIAERPGLVGLTTKDDVVELVRPPSDELDHAEDIHDFSEHEEDHEQNEQEQELPDSVTHSDGDDLPSEHEESPDESDVVHHDDDSHVVPENDVKVLHEEDDTLVSNEVVVTTDDQQQDTTDEVEEEDFDDEEHAVDEDAHDVVVEAAPIEDEEDEEIEEHALDDNQRKREGPAKLPKYKREELEERGFGHVLYAYRVVAPNVAIRTKPSPIGALAATSKDKMGLTKDSHKMGDIVVGYKLAKVHGLWLKIGPYTWAPVTKKETLDGPFHPVMKQIRKISIPGNLRKYWRMRVVDCDAVYKKADLRQLCQDKNMIRNGVLNVMRRMKLMDSSMDPDVHPFPSRFAPRRTLHATSLTDAQSQPNSLEQPVLEEPHSVDTVSAATDSLDQPLEHRSTQPDAEIVHTAGDLQEAVESGEQSEGNVEEQEDEVDTDVECRQFKFWHLCARHARCAWRRMPNLEYCDLDTDPAIDPNSIPAEMRQNPIYDFSASTRAQPRQKYFLYQPSGGWNNQRLLLESALIICKLTNRTCILPPAAPHSNYFHNYNNIPASAVVGMPRVLNFEALNKVVPTVAVPAGMNFKTFLDNEVFKTPRRFSVKTVVRDVTKYKPGTMKKWSERDIVKLFGPETADILYFANQTLWGTIEWKGSIAGWPERKQVHRAVMYPNHLKKVARKLAEYMGPYHAVHVRRGDKVFESSFSRVYHDPDWYASRISEFRELTPKVYIATDEPNRAYFDAFKNYQLTTIFWESLPGVDQVLRPYLQHFPKRMFMDILGMIEQLLGAYANLFLGSGYSTFTTYILRLRKYRDVIATDTSFSDPALGLPANVRNQKSTCDPIKALTHVKPC